MSQALEESMRMYEEENRLAPADERLEVTVITCSMHSPSYLTYVLLSYIITNK